MDERGADQPRHEGGVFNRIPEPPASPAEFVIRPPTAERYAGRQKDPGRKRPWPGPPCPGRVEPSSKQGSDSKRKCDRKAHVAHVEHGWMNRQPRILKQGVEITPVHRRRELSIKRV